MLRILISAAVCLISVSCSLPKTYEISPELVAGKYQRVGILVMRMGNYYPETPAPVTIQTDYAVRTPKAQSTMGLSVDKVDVCIEDESRIPEVFPDYPIFKSRMAPTVQAKFFGNISSQIYAGASNVLLKKGYQVVDVKELSQAWTRPIMKMTIADILAALSQDADALLVVHYTDIADYYYNAVNVVLDSKGFSYLDYTVSMFDTAAKKRVLYYDPMGSVLITKAMINDPDIAPDSGVLQKIIINENSIPLGFFNRYDRSKMVSIDKFSVRYELEDAQVIGYALKYFAKGISYETPSGYKINWKGLDQMVP